MAFQDFLTSLGVNITSNVIYDFIKTFFVGKPNSNQAEFKEASKGFLSIDNAQIFSDKIINFLADNGDIVISGSSIFSSESIMYKSSSGTNFQIKNNTNSRTDHNSIEVGTGDCIKGSGGASINQTDKGITILA